MFGCKGNEKKVLFVGLSTVPVSSCSPLVVRGLAASENLCLIGCPPKALVCNIDFHVVPAELAATDVLLDGILL